MIMLGEGWNIQVVGKDLIVTLPGTGYRVVYHKPENAGYLVTKRFPHETEEDARVTQGHFLAEAWKLANARARELGWIRGKD